MSFGTIEMIRKGVGRVVATEGEALRLAAAGTHKFVNEADRIRLEMPGRAALDILNQDEPESADEEAEVFGEDLED